MPCEMFPVILLTHACCGQDLFNRAAQRNVPALSLNGSAAEFIQGVSQSIGKKDTLPFILSADCAAIRPVQLNSFPAAAISAVATDKNGLFTELPREVRDGIALRTMDPVRTDINAILRENTST